jgi:hypothetical protein
MAASKNEKQIKELMEAIGEFIFNFSRLECALRFGLAADLDLEGPLFEPVIGPYDFAMLCKVQEAVSGAKHPPHIHENVKKILKRALALNQSRVIIAHGTWDFTGATHISRNSLKSSDYFKTPAEIKKLADEAIQIGSDYLNLEIEMIASPTAEGDNAV